MPIYEYGSKEAGCAKCEGRFTTLQEVSEPALSACPDCGSPVERVFSIFAIGGSKPAAKTESAKKTQATASKHNHNCAAAGCHSKAKNLIEKKFGK